MNATRGTTDVPPTPYATGFQVTLLQGTYRVLVRSGTLPVPIVNDTIVVRADVPNARTYNVTGLESSTGVGTFQLTVTNQFPLDRVTVWSGTTNLGTVASGAVRNFTVQGCVTITVTIVDDDDDEDDDGDDDDGGDGRPGGILGQVVDTFIMPNSNYSRIVGATAAAITVVNNLNVKVQVFKDAVFVGEVAKKKTKTFGGAGFVAGNVITVKRVDTGVVVKTVTLVAGTQSTSVP
jgi:hypothetical protein